MLIFTAKLNVKAGQEQEFERIMSIVAPKIREEPGNQTYICHRSMQDPRVFMVYEEYDDQAALEAHRAHLHAMRIDLPLAGSEWVAPAAFATSAAPAFRAKTGRIVVLALTNRAATATVFHLHGHHFRLLDRLDDGWKPYWLDTLAVEPGQTERIAFAAEYAGRWLMEAAATDWAAPKLLRWYSVD